MLLAEAVDGGRLPYWHTYLSPVQIASAVADEQLQPHIPEDAPADLQVRSIVCVNVSFEEFA